MMKFQPRKPGGHVESKREIWRSKIDKPMGPGMLLTLIPTLIMCVFLVMAAPYLKSITLKFFEMDREEVLLPVELAEDLEPELPAVPPPNPDIAIAELYQKQFDEQGFDWRTPPKIELPVSATVMSHNIRNDPPTPINSRAGDGCVLPNNAVASIKASLSIAPPWDRPIAVVPVRPIS